MAEAPKNSLPDWLAEEVVAADAGVVVTIPFHRVGCQRDDGSLGTGSAQQLDSEYGLALTSADPIYRLLTGEIPWHVAPADLIVDPPEKVRNPDKPLSKLLLGQFAELWIDPRQRALIVSPYFVPGAFGMAYFLDWRQHGVQVDILTNAYAASDVPVVHAGYANYRIPLLEAGVNLHELKPVATAVLAPSEIEGLIATLRSMIAEGKSIVFISHKLQEVTAIADRVTVLRKGRVTAAGLPIGEMTRQELARLMVGRDVVFSVDKKQQEPGEIVLSVANIHADNDKGLPAVRGVTLDVRAGEIVGLAGVAGNGQNELSQVITGLRRCTEGCVELNGEVICNQWQPVQHPAWPGLRA